MSPTTGVEDGRVGAEAAYDVPLADDAVDGLAVGADDDGTDVVLGQQGDQVTHGGVRD